jgi:uncharacterized membrane protein
MMEWLSNLLPWLPAELKIFFSSMLPVTELRASIPFAITVHDFPLWKAFTLGVLGNATAAFILITFLDPVIKLIRKHLPFTDPIFEKLFHKTRTKHSKKLSEVGHLALIFFVAVPLPGSGAWTGCLIAYVFGIKKKLSALLIFTGLLISGAIMTFGTEGLVRLFGS